ncbi:MAG: TIM-barrel domain-containing protein [Lentisphaerota bacterium]
MENKTICLENKKSLRVDFVNPAVFRIRLSEDGKFKESGLNRYGIIKDESPEFKYECVQENGSVIIKTSDASLEISEANGAVSLLDSQGRLLVRETAVSKSSDGNGFNVGFGLEQDERLYGLGDIARDRIERRGQKGDVIVKNVACYLPIPFVMSTNGWAVFLNTTWYHHFDAGATDKDILSFSGTAGQLDYYLIAGKNLADILDKYTQITGKPHLLPKWGYGLTYVNDEREVRARDVLNDAYSFRREGIPCDMMGLEPDWMEKHYDYSTDKKWSETRFHIPFWLGKKSSGTFVGALNNMGFKLSLWLCCDYDLSEYEESLVGHRQEEQHTDLQNLEDDIIKDPHFSPSYMDQITKPGVPWFEHLKKFVDDGADAFKLDGSNQICFHPDRKWKNGMEDAEMHNLYPLIYGKQMSLGYKEHTGKRAMIFTPSGYAGIQQYCASWSGDTGGEAKPLVSLLNHGMSGHSNVCTDMSVKNEAGIHFGFFQTLAQAFSWHHYNQPWFLGTKKQEMYKFYARLRYSLMPYIYSMAHGAARTAMPVMRAMPLAFPDDRKCDAFIYQYMFGQYFLVSAFADTVYLPEGRWVDYWTSKMIQGPVEIPVEYPENRGGALFVKAGAIIPMQEDCDFIGTNTPEKIIWDVFPHGHSSFELFEDDGETYNYLKGETAVTRAVCNMHDKKLEFNISPRKGSYFNMPKHRVHDIVIHLESKPEKVEVDTEWIYDSQQKTLRICNIAETSKGISVLCKLQVANVNGVN